MDSGMIVGLIVGALVLVLIVLLIVALVRQSKMKKTDVDEKKRAELPANQRKEFDEIVAAQERARAAAANGEK